VELISARDIEILRVSVDRPLLLEQRRRAKG
jgi:hypothetical protein